MSHRVHSDSSMETPIERIFRKVMHRKMTREEKVYFHLKPMRAGNLGNSQNGSNPHNKKRAKLTQS
jgi:hypothetical protein